MTSILCWVESICPAIIPFLVFIFVITILTFNPISIMVSLTYPHGTYCDKYQTWFEECLIGSTKFGLHNFWTHPKTAAAFCTPFFRLLAHKFKYPHFILQLRQGNMLWCEPNTMNPSKEDIESGCIHPNSSF